MWVLKLIRQYFEPRFHSAIRDPRPDLEKSRDYQYESDVLLARGGIGTRITSLDFTPYNQWTTSSCGAHAGSHVRKISENGDNFPLNWYRSRVNYKDEGMYLKNVLELTAFASNTEAPDGAPTDRFTEKYANSMVMLDLFNNDRKKKYEYIQIAPYDSSAVIDSVSNGYSTVIGFYSTYEELDFEVIPKDITSVVTAPIRHFVTCIPNSYHEKDGYEWVSVVDSFRNKGHSLRHIRKDFLNKRMFLGAGFCRKIVSEVETVITPAPDVCKYGDKNKKVLSLQIMLTQLGLLDKTSQTSYYGNLTAAAVLKWQLANASLFTTNVVELTKLGGKYYGKQSVAASNTLYSQ